LTLFSKSSDRDGSAHAIEETGSEQLGQSDEVLLGEIHA
jgi:hypothetical protein